MKRPPLRVTTGVTLLVIIGLAEALLWGWLLAALSLALWRAWSR